MDMIDPACRPRYFGLTVPFAPSKEYLLAVGQKKIYGALLPTSEATTISAATSSKLVAAAAGIAAGTAASALVAAAISANIAALFPFAGAFAGSTALGVVGSAGAAVAGPAAVVLVAVLIAALYIVNWVNDEANLAAINSLELEKQLVLSTRDLLSHAFISSSSGLHKLSVILANASIGDVPSTMPLPAHATSDELFSITDLTTGPTTTSPTISYLDGPGQVWTATPVLGGWFASRRVDGSADSFSPTLDVKDFVNYKFASRKNMLWLVSKQTPAKGDVLCKAGSNGVSTWSANCAAYVASTVDLYGSNSHMLRVGLAPSPYPVFDSPTTFNTASGFAQTLTVRARASAAPSISLVGVAPAGISVTSAAGGVANIAVAASVPPGNYILSLRATNGTASTGQTINIAVGVAFNFTSSNAAQTVSDGTGSGFRDGYITLSGIPPYMGLHSVGLDLECRDPQYPQLAVSKPNPSTAYFEVYDLADVVSYVAVTFSDNTYNTDTSQYTSVMTIRNVGGSYTPGHVYVFFPPVAGIEFTNEAGFGLENLAYFSSGRNLAPGEAVDVPVSFVNAGSPGHVFRPRKVLAGNLPQY